MQCRAELNLHAPYSNVMLHLCYFLMQHVGIRIQYFKMKLFFLFDWYQ